MMILAATYVCPLRGLISLEPPEPARLSEAARTAAALGLSRIFLPILEECLIGPVNRKIRFLDGLIKALDRLGEAGLKAWLAPLAEKVLDLNFRPPHLLRAGESVSAEPVFSAGRLKRLRPLHWWREPALIQKRLKMFQGLVSSLSCHPALEGWLLLDGALELERPGIQAADLVLRSLVGEIKDQDERAGLSLGVGWPELTSPELVGVLAPQVAGLRLGGSSNRPLGLDSAAGLADEIIWAAFSGGLGAWLWPRPVAVETGWAGPGTGDQGGDIVRAGQVLAGQGLAGLSWLSLIDPEAMTAHEPPWILKPGLEKVGLLDCGGEPKAWVEPLLEAVTSTLPRAGADDFIDLDQEEYGLDPQKHLPRLWGRFKRELRA